MQILSLLYVYFLVGAAGIALVSLLLAISLGCLALWLLGPEPKPTS